MRNHVSYNAIYPNPPWYTCHSSACLPCYTAVVPSNQHKKKGNISVACYTGEHLLSLGIFAAFHELIVTSDKRAVFIITHDSYKLHLIMLTLHICISGMDFISWSSNTWVVLIMHQSSMQGSQQKAPNEWKVHQKALHWMTHQYLVLGCGSAQEQTCLMKHVSYLLEITTFSESMALKMITIEYITNWSFVTINSLTQSMLTIWYLWAFESVYFGIQIPSGISLML